MATQRGFATSHVPGVPCLFATELCLSVFSEIPARWGCRGGLFINETSGFWAANATSQKQFALDTSKLKGGKEEWCTSKSFLYQVAAVQMSVPMSINKTCTTR